MRPARLRGRWPRPGAVLTVLLPRARRTGGRAPHRLRLPGALARGRQLAQAGWPMPHGKGPA
eukprot:12275560-Alexandrium_andersonii.AAC.1